MRNPLINKNNEQLNNIEMAGEEEKKLPWPKGAVAALDFDFLMVGKDDNPVMKITKSLLLQMLTINAGLVPTVVGGATQATAVVLPADAAGQIRKMEKVVGWFKNPTGAAWEAPIFYDNVNFWTGSTWKLGASIPMPKSTEEVVDDSLFAIFDPTGKRVALWNKFAKLETQFAENSIPQMAIEGMRDLFRFTEQQGDNSLVFTDPTGFKFFGGFTSSGEAYFNKLRNVEELKSYIRERYFRKVLLGKDVVITGDSIVFEGFWTNSFRQVTGAKVYNIGLSGCRWAAQAGQNDIKGRIDAIDADVSAKGYIPDVIIVAMGTNDWGNNLPIGVLADVRAKSYNHVDVQGRVTVLDAIKYGITRLKKTYPSAFIAITTPLQRDMSPSDIPAEDKSYLKPTEMLYNQAIKDGGMMMGVPVFDCHTESGLIWYDQWAGGGSTPDFRDNLHPNAAGGQKQGRYIAKKLINAYHNVI